MKWGVLLKQARDDAELTQRQLAARLGIPASTVSRYETGAMLPSLRRLDRVLEACGKDVEAALVRRHADVDAELDRLRALSVRDRLWQIDLLTSSFVNNLGRLGSVLIGGAWAAAIHGIPREHAEGTLWVAGDDAAIVELAAFLRPHFITILEDGEFRGLEVRPGTFARNPRATWRVKLVGVFTTIVVPPGDPWPAEVRIDGEEGPLRVLTPGQLTVEDGVRPELLERWLAR